MIKGADGHIGNCDYTGWFDLDHSNFISDADRIFDAFDIYCHKAGLEKCALWDKTPQAIQDRRSNLLESLKKKPVLIPAWSRPTGPDLPVLVTYSRVQMLARTVIYKPITQFPELAQVYAALERGDGLPFYDMVTKGVSSDIDLCTLGDMPATVPQETTMEMDAFPAIMCSDMVPIADTAEEFAEFGKKLQGVSRWAGATNLAFRGVCLGKTVRPKWKFSVGKLTLSLDNVVKNVGNVLTNSVEDFKMDTAHPILFIGNMADNVTPLESAFNNSAHFPSSIVLKQNSYGVSPFPSLRISVKSVDKTNSTQHCSSAQPSTCTTNYIRAYFQNGTLPDAGTECDSDYELFQFPHGKPEVMEMDDLKSAMYELSEEVDFGHLPW